MGVGGRVRLRWMQEGGQDGDGCRKAGKIAMVAGGRARWRWVEGGQDDGGCKRANKMVVDQYAVGKMAMVDRMATEWDLSPFEGVGFCSDREVLPTEVWYKGDFVRTERGQLGVNTCSLQSIFRHMVFKRRTQQILPLHNDTSF